MKTFLFSLVALVIVNIAMPRFAYANEREYAIKVGFIYNFARYSEGDWFNEEASSPYRMCFSSQSVTDVATKALSEETLKGHQITVHHIQTPEANCHTVFISREVQSDTFLNSDKFAKTMRIAEHKDAISHGAHLNFFISGGKVRFEVDQKGLSESGIKLSSKVIRIGRQIGSGE